jgi:DNA gyrase inhibitor GyrI
MRTMYVAAVEVATRQQVDLDEAMKTLVDYRPALGTSPRGWVEVQISFPATGLAHACTTAAAIARAATGAEAIACQVMTEREYEARHGIEQGAVSGGRHAADQEDKPWVLPRQSTEAWERPERERGRHSA